MIINLLILLLWIIIIALLILKIWFESNVSNIENKQSPGRNLNTYLPVINDKIVIVKDVESDYLTQAIHQFCNLYNKEDFIVLPRMIKEDYMFVITFPQNIKFDRFCYFVNYLGNPDDLCNYSDYQPNIKAWCTTQPVDLYLNEVISNKKIMLFIPESEIKLDRMYIATNDNNVYKISISHGDLLIKPDLSDIRYEGMPFDVNILKDRKFVDFK